MQDTRPPRKRAGTLTNAVPQIAARRVRLDNTMFPAEKLDSSDLHFTTSPQSSTAGTRPTMEESMTTYPILENEYLNPCTPFPSPELQLSEAALDRLFTVHSYTKRPGHANDFSRDEFPFPVQGEPEHICNKNLEITTPQEANEYEFHAALHGHQRPAFHPLPTLPCSASSIPVSSSYTPSLINHDFQDGSSAGPSSGLPSLCSSDSQSSEIAHPPKTIQSRNDSAATTLRLILLADDLGMSAQELLEITYFAQDPKNGAFPKRAGRVLVRKEAKRRKTRDGKDIESSSVFQELFHRRRECVKGDCFRHARPDMWKEIDWSKFSDTSDDDMPDATGNVNAVCDSDEEMTAIEGYLRMAMNADKGHDSLDQCSTAARAEMRTAKMAWRMRPAKLCMRSSSQRVKASIGPLNERVWPRDL